MHSIYMYDSSVGFSFLLLFYCHQWLASVNYFIVYSTAQLCWVNQIIENFHIIANVWFFHWQVVHSNYIIDSVDILLEIQVYVLWFLGAKGCDIKRVLFHQTSGLSWTHSRICKMESTKLQWFFMTIWIERRFIYDETHLTQLRIDLDLFI